MDSRRGVIEEFLAVHPGPFCADCLGLALDIPAGQVSMAKHRLTATGALRSEHAPCSRCNRVRLVVAAAGTPAGASVSQATVDGVALLRSISVLRYATRDNEAAARRAGYTAFSAKPADALDIAVQIQRPDRPQT